MEDCQREIEDAIEQRRQDLEKLCQSKKIDLSALELDDLDALCVAISLIRREEEIESLYIGSNSIKDEGMEALSSALSKHTEVKELYLGSNSFLESGMNSVINVIPELSNLTTLSLGLSSIGDALCTSLSGSLLAMTRCSLKFLFLNGNKIGDEGLLSLMYE
jgi:Ran GTPase-activating protein (RanGAP) involved in mRNA processing and transport